MKVEWVGLEPLCFPSSYLMTLKTDPGCYDADFCRCAVALGDLWLAGAYADSPTFSNLSTNYFSMRWSRYGGDAGYPFLIFKEDGVSKIGIAISSDGYPQLVDLETSTALATSTTTLFPGNNASPQKLDVSINATGGTVKVYADGILQIDYSGSLNFSYINKLLFRQPGTANNMWIWMSEIMVADYDLRERRLCSYHPNGDGDTNEWDYGTYADIDELVVNDADQIWTDTADKIFTCAMTNTPAGDFVVDCFGIKGRCVDGIGSLGAKLGIKSGGAVDVESTAQNCTGYWQTVERKIQSSERSLTTSEIDSLQLAIESGTV